MPETIQLNPTPAKVRYRIEVNFAGTGNDVWRKGASMADDVGRREFMDEDQKVETGKKGARHVLSNEERLARLTPEEREALGKGVGVHAGSAGKIGSSDVLAQAYAYGHTDAAGRPDLNEYNRAIDPDKVHRLAGGAEIHGRNIFYGRRTEPASVEGGLPVEVVDYSAGGAWGVDGGFRGGLGHMEEQAAFMVLEVNQRVQKILHDHPDADIDIEVRGHSRGGVSAAEFERDMRGIYWDNPHLHFRNLQLDPVPGGVMMQNPGYEKHFDQQQGAVHESLVDYVRGRADFQRGDARPVSDTDKRPGVMVDGEMKPIEQGKPRPGDQHAVVYSVKPGGLGKAVFTPQEVMGADVVIVTPESHDLYQKRAQLRDGQIDIGGYEVQIDGEWQHVGGADLAKLPKGIYVAQGTEEGMLLHQIPIPNAETTSPEQARQFAEDVIRAAGGSNFNMNPGSDRHEVLRGVLMNQVNPDFNAGHYASRSRDTSTNVRPDGKISSHVHRDLLTPEKIEASEQEYWAKDIVDRQQRQMAEQDPSALPRFEKHFKDLEVELKKPENYAVARDMHEQYKEIDDQNQAIAEGAEPAGLRAQAEAPSETRPSHAPSFFEGIKQRFYNALHGHGFNTDQQVEALEAEQELSPFAVHHEGGDAFSSVEGPPEPFSDAPESESEQYYESDVTFAAGATRI